MYNAYIVRILVVLHSTPQVNWVKTVCLTVRLPWYTFRFVTAEKLFGNRVINPYYMYERE